MSTEIVRRPKKNIIFSNFFTITKLIKSNYKGRKIEKDLLDGTLDVAVFLMQFNLNTYNVRDLIISKFFKGRRQEHILIKKLKMNP
ncbi:MAG: hypothetical protein ACJZ16_01745 [Methylophilaceae bacterium]